MSDNLNHNEPTETQPHQKDSLKKNHILQHDAEEIDGYDDNEPKLPTPNHIRIQQPAVPKPKRAPRVIIKDLGLHPDIPPTLAQFVDSLDDTSQGEYIRHISMLSVDQMWMLEDKRQAVIKEFPRAFAPDLTPEEQSHVNMLFHLQEPLMSRSTKIQILFFLVITFLFALFMYFQLNINLFYHAHLIIAYMFSPDANAEKPDGLKYLISQFLPRHHQIQTQRPIAHVNPTPQDSPDLVVACDGVPPSSVEIDPDDVLLHSGNAHQYHIDNTAQPPLVHSESETIKDEL